MLPVFVASCSPPPSLPPALLSLITQLLLGNVVPAGPYISSVAVETERTHADMINTNGLFILLFFLGFPESCRATHTRDLKEQKRPHVYSAQRQKHPSEEASWDESKQE